MNNISLDKEVNEEHEKNRQAFLEQLPRLIQRNYGKYAVGRAGEEFDCWDTYGDALQEGYKKYGLKNFYVGRVVEQVPIFISRALSLSV